MFSTIVIMRAVEFMIESGGHTGNTKLLVITGCSGDEGLAKLVKLISSAWCYSSSYSTSPSPLRC